MTPTVLPTIQTELRGRAIMANSLLNKSTAFTEAERDALGLRGLLPATVETLEQQVARVKVEFDRHYDDLERHIYLRALQDSNEVLFYRFLQEHLEVALPIVYTPTVGLATQQFSRIFRRARGLFLSYPDRGTIAEQLARWDSDVDVVVVTDGERILGLGDQGVGGMGIPNGKLSLYTAFGGINPARTLPVVLDVGTNNQERLGDSCYLGWRHERITGDDYDAFVDEFVTALKERFPHVLLQWEDFAQHNATRLLERYQSSILSFNDDIQGTAAVAVAAIWSAVAGTGGDFAHQRFVILGAGSAGTGIGEMIHAALLDAGVEDPSDRIALVDRTGIVHDGRSDLRPHQTHLAYPADKLEKWGGAHQSVDLLQAVAGLEATVLVGVSGQPGLFTQQVIEQMAANTARPVILPLSNPTSRAEATPADILTWTKGRAVVATGSPFDDVTIDGRTIHISQANNVYVFPGLGLGAVATKAKAVTPSMFMAAAKAVRADDNNSIDDGVLPPLGYVRVLSRRIAIAVAKQARAEGLTDDFGDDEIEALVDATMWQPAYQPIEPV